MSCFGVVVKVFGIGGGIVGICDLEICDYVNWIFNEVFYLDVLVEVKLVDEFVMGIKVYYWY